MFVLGVDFKRNVYILSVILLDELEKMEYV